MVSRPSPSLPPKSTAHNWTSTTLSQRVDWLAMPSAHHTSHSTLHHTPSTNSHTCITHTHSLCFKASKFELSLYTNHPWYNVYNSHCNGMADWIYSHDSHRAWLITREGDYGNNNSRQRVVSGWDGTLYHINFGLWRCSFRYDSDDDHVQPWLIGQLLQVRTLLSRWHHYDKTSCNVVIYYKPLAGCANMIAKCCALLVQMLLGREAIQQQWLQFGRR